MPLKMRTMLAVALAAVVGATAPGAPVGAGDGRHDPELAFLGQAIVPTGTTFAGTTVGGLSSITYDPRRRVYHALSDDQGALQPARFYTLHVDVSDGRLSDGDVRFDAVTTLLTPDGLPYAAASLDPEGLTLTKSGDLIVTSEGFAARNIAPWIRRHTVGGTYLADLRVPPAFDPTGPTHGVRQNLGFEAAAVTPNGRRLYVGTEGALAQDGPAASFTATSPARILRYELPSGRLQKQYVYVTDTVAEPPMPPTSFSVNGLVELLPFDDDHLLAMERSFSVGAPGTGNTIKIYSVDIDGATNVNGLDSLADVRRAVRPVRKELLLDLGGIGLPLDNVEGMVVGPRLPDGRRSLLLVSDNNFATSQFTQFLLFALD